MTYEESISWLFTQFPAYQNVGVSAYKPDLDNVLALCEHFEVDYKSLKYIHIAGTNGKGSTSNYLASVLQESGLKVGLFTSPHILDFRERIRVNGSEVSEQKGISFCKRIQESSFDVKPSFFEITWVLALIHFLDEKVDICVIETGLGGRLDATNIITPILSIITNIGLDHTAILGDSIEKIAFEKAGIIKNNIPVLIGEVTDASQKVFEKKAKETNSEIFYSSDFKVENTFFPSGTYPKINEQTVRAAIEILNRGTINVSEQSVSKGLKNVFQNTGFYGRFQQISKKPTIIVDAAHNEHGIRKLVESIQSLTFERLHILYGASNDKAIDSILDLFPEEAELNLCSFTNLRSFSFAELQAIKEKNPKIKNIFPSVKEAFSAIQNSVNENDIFLITGSFFLLSDFFTFFSQKDLRK